MTNQAKPPYSYSESFIVSEGRQAHADHHLPLIANPYLPRCPQTLRNNWLWSYGWMWSYELQKQHLGIA